MPEAWQQFVGGNPIVPTFPYDHPLGDRTHQPWDRQALEAHMDRIGAEAAILSHDVSMFVPALPSHYLAAEITKAVNQWTVDRWLDGDTGRLWGSILVSNQFPQEAADEIRRLGKHPRMATVLLGGNGLGKPFGHPLYHPIYEAAEEVGLPVTIHVGGDAVVETLTATAAGGPPTLYVEYQLLAAQPIMTHLVSLIAQGVFEKYPHVRVLFAGAGVAWLPSLMWRFDAVYNAYRREIPWLHRAPTSYLRDHIRITTYPLDSPPHPEQLIKLLQAFPVLEDMLCFASGYPAREGDDPHAIQDRLPASWLPKIFRDNARDLYGWSKSKGHNSPVVAEV